MENILEILDSLDNLKSLLSVEDYSKPKINHKFYKHNGLVLEQELKEYEFNLLSTKIKNLYTKHKNKTSETIKYALITSDTNKLKQCGVTIEEVDFGRPTKLAENTMEFQIIWDSVVSKKTNEAKKELDDHELEDVRLELKEQLLNAKAKYKSVTEAGKRDNVLSATCTKFIEFLDSFNHNQDTPIDFIKNPHPTIFVDGAFEIFQLLINKFSDKTEYQKISFIVQKLKAEEKLITTNCKKLSHWLLENSFIDKDTYNQININNYFISPAKILTQKRLDLYNSIIGI